MNKGWKNLIIIVIFWLLSFIILYFLAIKIKQTFTPHTYKLTYVVYYPNTPDTVTVYLKHEADLYSSQGTNYIQSDGLVIETTSIIKILKQTQIK
jgi:hypothetical protein